MSGGALAPAGPVAAVLAEVSWVLIGGATFFFLATMAALAWALARRRPPGAGRPPGDAAAIDRPDPAARRWILVCGLVIPSLTLLALLVYATARTPALAPPRAPDELVVTVTGRLWWWQVHYHQPSRGIDLVLANEVHLPVGRPVTLGLVSADVIHSFWVPELAGKVDLVPGRTHQLRLQADRAGRYRGQCAEYCGDQHARMALHVVAHPPDAFEHWLAAQMRPAAPPDGALARRGAEVFLQQRCDACHTVRGIGADATLGPDLTHLASRARLGAGALPLNARTLAAWVADPQHAKPGVRMPSYGARLDEGSLQALVAFLEQLE